MDMASSVSPHLKLSIHYLNHPWRIQSLTQPLIQIKDLFHGYPSSFRGNYEEPEANLSYPYPTSSLRWGFCEREDLGFTCLPGVEAYEEKEEEEGLQSNGYGDWLSTCWEEDNYGGSYKSGEEDHEPCSEHLQNLSGSENNDPWPWVQGGDYGFQRAEARVGSEEMGVVGLCEGIFGHWPCLLREYHKTYGQRSNITRHGVPREE